MRWNGLDGVNLLSLRILDEKTRLSASSKESIFFCSKFNKEPKSLLAPTHPHRRLESDLSLSDAALRQVKSCLLRPRKLFNRIWPISRLDHALRSVRAFPIPVLRNLSQLSGLKFINSDISNSFSRLIDFRRAFGEVGQAETCRILAQAKFTVRREQANGRILAILDRRFPISRWFKSRFAGTTRHLSGGCSTTSLL